jgi:arylsulfatase
MRFIRYLLLASLIGLASCQQTSNKTDVSENPSPKPNILLIVADDLGYSDIGPFGGDIKTPVLDKLGKESMLFSNFHVLPTCSPSRSALLTGNDNHVAGVGIMSEMDYPALHDQQLPGYSASLSKQVATIPELLRENGYHTYMVGKWHLGEKAGQLPADRGFEESFILGTGGGSHFNDRRPLSPLQHMDYYRNRTMVELPENFYSTRDYTDTLIRFMDMHREDKKPFFAFLSYTAVHDPMHAPDDYIAKYKGAFDKGWDSLWLERFNNLKALGILPKEMKTKKNPAIPGWNKLSAKDKAANARDMEVYAAMLDYMDMSIGRVLDHLRKSGQYDNTVIIFISDNGANGALGSTYPGNEDGKYMATFDNSLEARGKKGSYAEMGPGWAQASSAPFRYFKSFTTEGGIRAPLIMKVPGASQQGGQWNHELFHVTDIMPTLLEITGTSYPESFSGNKLHPLIGKSLRSQFFGAPTAVHEKDGIGYELFEMKAYIRGKWKLLRLPVPMGSGQWELYDLSTDPGETTDLSAQHPEIITELTAAWNRYAKENDVYDHKGHYDSLYRRSFK